MPGLSVMLNGPLYFGGVPAPLQNALGSSDISLAGCLGDVTINSVFVNFADATERPNALLEKCPGKTVPEGQWWEGMEEEGERGRKKWGSREAWGWVRFTFVSVVFKSFRPIRAIVGLWAVGYGIVG